MLTHSLGCVDLLGKRGRISKLAADILVCDSCIALQLSFLFVKAGDDHAHAFLSALIQPGKPFLIQADLRLQALDIRGEAGAVLGGLTVDSRDVKVALTLQPAELRLVAVPEGSGPLDHIVLLLQALQLTILLTDGICIPMVEIVAGRNVLCDVGNECLLVADVAVDVLA